MFVAINLLCLLRHDALGCGNTTRATHTRPINSYTHIQKRNVNIKYYYVYMQQQEKQQQQDCTHYGLFCFLRAR